MSAARRSRGCPARFNERLRVPCTPSELAAAFGLSLRSARSYLFQLKARGIAERTNTKIPKENPRGRKYEYLWRLA